RATDQVLCVAGDGGIFQPASQLTLQLQDLLVLSAAGNRWRQVIREDPNTTSGPHHERRILQHVFQYAGRKEPHPASEERLRSPSGRKVALTCGQIGGLKGSLQYFACLRANQKRQYRGVRHHL